LAAAAGGLARLLPDPVPSPEIPTVRLHTGQVGNLPASALALPGRAAARGHPHSGAARSAAHRPRRSGAIRADPEDAAGGIEYADRGADPGGRAARCPRAQGARQRQQRLRGPARQPAGRPGGRGKRACLRGRSSLRDAFTRSDSTLARGDWKERAVTATRVWSEKSPQNEIVLRYEASVEPFVNDQPFEAKRIDGAIPRRWI
jgi:hypothetical protein